jgi:polyisoprenoid-binding protein YceI
MKSLLFLLFWSLASWGNNLEIKVTLEPAGSFSAKSGQLKVEGPSKLTGTAFKFNRISVPIQSLETGLSLRDRHMKDNYFEMAKYPHAVLIDAEGKEGSFQGKLQVHGIQKDIQGTYWIKSEILEATFKCRLSDFRIKQASYMGVGVEDEVTVIAQVRVAK